MKRFPSTSFIMFKFFWIFRFTNGVADMSIRKLSRINIQNEITTSTSDGAVNKPSESAPERFQRSRNRCGITLSTDMLNGPI